MTAMPMTMMHFVKIMVEKVKHEVAFLDWHKKKPQIFCLKFVPCEEIDTWYGKDDNGDYDYYEICKEQKRHYFVLYYIPSRTDQTNCFGDFHISKFEKQ